MADQLREYIGWRKSTRSNAPSDNCVEVGHEARGQGVGVRDTKDRGGPVLEFGNGDWLAFLNHLRS